jgi:hypothetical protein
LVEEIVIAPAECDTDVAPLPVIVTESVPPELGTRLMLAVVVPVEVRS